ncbi:MAG TPA: hypothetical protein VN661_08630 [Candidatus Acidoferrales bacterium]|nr:hypothetical protein [Candidatus Acidoferrales bacterium]
MPLTQDLPRDIRTRPKRRGNRMNSRVPVSIEWNGGSGPLRFESGYTRVVNPYGCLLVSPAEMNPQQKLRLTNLATRLSSDATVVWKGTQRPDGWDLGVELSSGNTDFWGVDL